MKVATSVRPSKRQEKELCRLIEVCKTLDITEADDESELFCDYQRAVEAFASRYHRTIAEVEQTVLNSVV